MTNQNSKIDKNNKKIEENKQKDLISEPKVDNRVEELEDQVKRTLADYQNLEKRVSQERQSWILKGNRELLLHLLPILDTLIIAKLHSKDISLDISVKQFLDILKKEGVEKIETVGKTFDPNLMECVQTVNGQENEVIEETRAGFMLFEEVLRPAQVKVGKKE